MGSLQIARSAASSPCLPVAACSCLQSLHLVIQWQLPAALQPIAALDCVLSRAVTQHVPRHCTMLLMRHAPRHCTLVCVPSDWQEATALHVD